MRCKEKNGKSQTSIGVSLSGGWGAGDWRELSGNSERKGKAVSKMSIMRTLIVT